MNELSDARGPNLRYAVGKGKEETIMKYLKIFTDFLDAMEPLTDEEAGRLYRAMLQYAKDGSEEDLLGNERFLWTVAKQHINREVAAYKTKVEADRENGKKGAAVRWQKIAKDGDPHSVNGENGQDNDNEKNNDNYKNNDNERVCRGFAPVSAAVAASRALSVPPSLEEIESYCRERGNSVNAQRFLDFYTANGWRIGKVPMKDWEAAVRSWETNGMDDKMGPAKERSYLDNFRGAMELLNMEEAKEV